jgi:hypothetical protein
MSAPSRQDASLAHTTSGDTALVPADVPNPQSVLAITRLRSPIAATASQIRFATTLGCSTKLVVASMTPGSVDDAWDENHFWR